MTKRKNVFLMTDLGLIRLETMAYSDQTIN